MDKYEKIEMFLSEPAPELTEEFEHAFDEAAAVRPVVSAEAILESWKVGTLRMAIIAKLSPHLISNLSLPALAREATKALRGRSYREVRPKRGRA